LDGKREQQNAVLIWLPGQGAHASLAISAAVLLVGAIAMSYGRTSEPR
jgi:hypothetical protein